MAMFEARGLEAGYGRARVLFGVSLEVRAGEVVALLGRNGAGKSTTLKAMMGLVPAQAGEVRLDGQRIDRLETHEIARLGVAYVPEERRIFTDLTVAENIEVGRQARRPGAPEWTDGPAACALSPARAHGPAARRISLGRRAANAVHRPQPRRQSAGDPSRRALPKASPRSSSSRWSRRSAA